ncbi:MAG TPA: class I SAM-dependent methyltransferase [bacterium]|nr:class I SAM-dependent methyltransferase [bacterium]
MAVPAAGEDLKQQVKEFWNRRSCGEVYADGDSEMDYYESHRRARFELEPYIAGFARFEEARGKDVLEIGVGMGADHVEWARYGPKSLSGIDMTPRAVEHTARRLRLYGLHSDVRVADAEALPFPDRSFDLVYSFGVLHHSPHTAQAVNEVHRVLRPGGTARIMIYHKYSLTGYMLWARYALLAGKPFRSLDEIYWNHLESVGTKAYTVAAAREMFSAFSRVGIRIQLALGDLLQGAAGQRHQGPALSLARKIWPRRLLKALFKNHGLDMMIEAIK